MPRGPVVYTLPPGTTPQQPNTTIPSAMFNAAMDDIADTFNTVQPEAYGGTGAATYIGAWDNIASAEDTVASAATLVLTGLTKPFFNISGTTGVTAVTLGTGTVRIGRIAGADVVFTASASLIMEGQTTGSFGYQQNSLLIFEGFASSTVRVWEIGTGGVTRANEGTAAFPGLSFFQDPDTGFYSIGANDLGVSVGGTGRAHWTTSEYSPVTNDALSLGSSSLSWSDLFLASGGVLNFNNGNVTVTHSNDLLRFTKTAQWGTFSTTGASIGTIVQASGGAGISFNTTAQSFPWAFWNPNGQVGNIAMSGSGTAFNTTSDQNLKTGFADFDSGAIIDALSVYHFEWKSGGSGFGVKAQETHTVFPDAVTVGSASEQYGTPGYEPWGVDYSKFVPVLLREIQGLRSRVAALETP